MAPNVSSKHQQEHREARERLRESVRALESVPPDFVGQEQLTYLLDLVRVIAEEAGKLDLDDLGFVPIYTLRSLREHLWTGCEVVRWINEIRMYLANEVRESHWQQTHQLSTANIGDRVQKLQFAHNEVFKLVAPILIEQTRRGLAPVLGKEISVANAQHAEPTLQDQDVVWKYMPFDNFVRSYRAWGIWMPTLAKLCEWSTRGISDTHEGEVPPVLKKMKAYWDELQKYPGPESAFLQRYPLNCADGNQLRGAMEFLYEKEKIHVCSWSRKPSESNVMWSYGGNGHGVALRSTVGKLKQGPWMVPFEYSGRKDDSLFHGLMIREVRYLTFTQQDVMRDVADLCIPVFKRQEFQEEREVRMIGFCNRPLISKGLPLHCNLHELLDEIVVGPKADFPSVEGVIKTEMPRLRRVPVRRSTLGPGKP